MDESDISANSEFNAKRIKTTSSLESSEMTHDNKLTLNYSESNTVYVSEPFTLNDDDITSESNITVQNIVTNEDNAAEQKYKEHCESQSFVLNTNDPLNVSNITVVFGNTQDQNSSSESSLINSSTVNSTLPVYSCLACSLTYIDKYSFDHHTCLESVDSTQDCQPIEVAIHLFLDFFLL